jgi:hypothetical protein
MGKKLILKNKKAAKKKAELQAARQAEKKSLDFGLSEKSHLIKKAKTHKGRKFLEKRGPQLVEGKKTAIFIKGLKASNVI